MRANPTITALKALSLAYVASASVFALAIVLQSNADWVRGIQVAARLAVPQVKSAAVHVQNTAAAVRDQAIQPAVAWAVRKDNEFFDWIDPHQPMVARQVPKKAAPPVAVAKVVPPVLRPAITELPKKPAVVAEAPPPQTAPARPALELAQQQPAAEPPSLVPAPDASPPSPGELARVMSHLKVSLTKEMYENFALFLYVSKADHGPWAQRMYVFQKQKSGDLNLLYTWPVSTGREAPTPGPKGNLLATDTPPGYYQLDPDRMYRRYHSMEWNQPMPHAMFFSWEHNGLQTGLAIHGAAGEDIGLLGKRASAGCVRLNPQNAALLYRLVRDNYKGLAPRFAYNRRTATMNNDGLLMHDKAGNLRYAEGYKVLVFIENNGGDNIVAALF